MRDTGEFPLPQPREADDVDAISSILYSGSAAYSEARLEVLRKKGLDMHSVILGTIASLDVVQPGDVVADVCCGNARLLFALNDIESGAEYVGIDANSNTFLGAEAIINEGGIKNIRLITHDVNMGIPLPDKSVDFLMSNFGLYHVGNWSQVLDEIRRVCKDDAHFEIATRGTDHLKTHWSIIDEICALHGVDDAETPYSHFDIDELRRQSAKFHPVKEVEDEQEFSISLSSEDRDIFELYLLSIIGEVQAATSKQGISPPSPRIIRELATNIFKESDGAITDKSHQLTSVMRISPVNI